MAVSDQKQEVGRVGEASGLTYWAAPPDGIVTDRRLEAGLCHVWVASLTADAAELGRLSRTLSETEHQRAGQFRFEKDRNAYVQCRGMLRNLLGSYLELSPETLCFSANGRGKPYLSEASNPLDVRFNLSHSDGMALFALTRSSEVGVDIERLQRFSDWTSVSEMAFSPREKAELTALSRENRVVGFFNGWTRKEAVAKATGEGLSLGLKHIEVSLTPGAPCRILGLRGVTGGISDWSLRHLDPAPDFVGAVAIERPNAQFRFGTWRSGGCQA